MVKTNCLGCLGKTGTSDVCQLIKKKIVPEVRKSGSDLADQMPDLGLVAVKSYSF